MPQVQLTTDECNTIVNALNQALASVTRAQKTAKQPHIGEAYKVAEGIIKELQSKFIKAATVKT